VHTWGVNPFNGYPRVISNNLSQYLTWPCFKILDLPHLAVYYTAWRRHCKPSVFSDKFFSPSPSVCVERGGGHTPSLVYERCFHPSLECDRVFWPSLPNEWGDIPPPECGRVFIIIIIIIIISPLLFLFLHLLFLFHLSSLLWLCFPQQNLSSVTTNFLNHTGVSFHNPALIRGPAFIYWVHFPTFFSHSFFFRPISNTGGLLN